MKHKLNILEGVCPIWHKNNAAFQKNKIIPTDPKHTSKSTSGLLKKKFEKRKVLEWPNQSPDLNPIEMLWHDLKKATCVWKLNSATSVAELKQFCKEEWARIPLQQSVIANFPKSLIAVCAAIKDLGLWHNWFLGLEDNYFFT